MYIGKFKPMKGIDCLGHLNEIVFPKLIQPKYDGTRIIFLNGVALSASLKKFRNKYIQKMAASGQYDGLDLEYVNTVDEGGLRCSNGTLNSYDKPLTGSFNVFDWIDGMPYEYRLEEAEKRAHKLGLEFAPTLRVFSEEQVRETLDGYLLDGYEGGMLKDPTALYKYGRSTLRSQECLKLKPFIDDDAIVVGWEPEYENTNEATTDALGHTVRSNAEGGKIPKQLVGSLLCNSPRFPKTFSIAGFTSDLKARMWAERDTLYGRKLTFKHQPSPVYSDAPRHPIFRRWIEDI